MEYTRLSLLFLYTFLSLLWYTMIHILISHSHLCCASLLCFSLFIQKLKGNIVLSCLVSCLVWCDNCLHKGCWEFITISVTQRTSSWHRCSYWISVTIKQMDLCFKTGQILLWSGGLVGVLPEEADRWLFSASSTLLHPHWKTWCSLKFSLEVKQQH